VRATATASHPSFFPRPGWSEQRPDDWWASTCAATRRVLRKGRISAADIGGVGLSGQMHGSVFLDPRQRVLRNALLWNDQRTGAECAEIERRAGGRTALIQLVRNVALTGYQAPKILWLRNHQPRLFRRLRTVLLPKDYVNLRLTGVRHSEVSDASGTLLFDVAGRRWSTELMQHLALDPDLFPPVVESREVVGELTRAAARATGLKAGTLVVAGAGDQAAAAVGTGVVQRGIVSATLGTSGVVFAHSDTPVPNDAGLLQSFCHAVPGAWCVFGCMLSAGGSLHWARAVLYADRLKATRTDAQRDAIYGAMIAEAAAAERDATLVFHPYLTGERCPYAHPHARGAFVGLTRRHGRSALVRAVLEGITLGLARQLDLMRALRVPIREVRLAGGGARNPWWRQLQADVYGCRCVAMRSEEGSALGAALLAAVGAGAFPDVPAASRAAAHSQHSYRPVAARHRHHQALAARLRDTYEILEPSYRATT
jgi:xylulokinase